MADQITIADLNLRLKSEGQSAAEGINALTKAFTDLQTSGLDNILTKLKAVADSFKTIVTMSQQAATSASKVQVTPAASAKPTPPVYSPKSPSGDYSDRQDSVVEAARLRLEAATIRLTRAETDLQQIQTSGKATTESLSAAYAKVATATANVLSSQERLDKALDNIEGSSKSLKNSFEQQTPAATSAALAARNMADNLAVMSSESRNVVINEERLAAATQALAAALQAGDPGKIAASRANLARITEQLVKAEEALAAASSNSAAAMSAETQGATQATAAVQTFSTTSVSAIEQVSRVVNLITFSWNGVMSVLRKVTQFTVNAAKLMKDAATSIVTFFQSGNKSQGLLRNLQKLRVNIYNIWYITQFAEKAFTSLFDKASQAYEVLHLFKAAYSDNSDAGNEAAEATYAMYQSMADLMGLDIVPMARTAATFKEMANAMGIVTESSDKMAQGLTQLTYDYASLFDMDFSVVQGKFQSALSGQTRAVRTFGLDVTQAALQEELLKEGISASVTELTRAQKTILIYNTMIRNSTNAQQDLAKSIMQPANMFRVLKEQMAIASRAFGSLFIPVIQAVLPYLIALAHWLTEVLGRIAQFFGIKMPDIASVAAGGLGDYDDALEDIEDDATGAASALKKMKDYTTGLDELNILKPPEPTQTGGAGAGGGGGFDIKPLDPYDFFGGEKPLETILKSLGSGIDDFAAAWKKVEDAAAGCFTAIGRSYDILVKKGVIENLKQSFTDAFVSILGIFSGFLEGFTMAFEKNQLGTALLQSFVDASSGILNVISLIGTAIGEWFTSDTGQVWIKNIMLAFKGIQDTVVELTDSFKSIWENGGREAFEEHILPALSSVVEMMLLVIDGVTQATGSFINWGLSSGFFSTLSDILRVITDTVGDIVTGMGEWFDSPAAQPFKDALQGIADAALRFAEAVNQWWNDGGAELVGLLATDISKFVESVANLATSFVEIGGLTALGIIIDILLRFFKFCVDNIEIIGLIALHIGGITLALKGLEFIMGIVTILETLGVIVLPAVAAGSPPAAAGLASFASASVAIPVLLTIAGVILSVAAAIAALLFGIAAIIEAIAHVVEAFTELTVVIIDKVIPNWDEFKVVIEEGVDLLANSLLKLGDPIKTFLFDFAQGLGAVALALGGMALGIGAVALAATIGAPGLIVLTGAALGIATAMDIAAGAIEKIDGVLSKSGDGIGKFGDVITGVFEGIKGVISGVAETVGGAVKALVNGVIRGVNTVIGGINGVIQAAWQIPVIGGLVPQRLFGTIPYLAAGGVIPKGQAFVAGEAGAELIGTHQGKTTVMPLENSGFVQAMAESVYGAVVSAMKSQTPPTSGDVYIDGDKVGRVLRKADQQIGIGLTPISIGV